MKEQVITKELAKLYEKQGYLEESLTCYTSLYEQTSEPECAEAISKIKNKINLLDNKVEKDNKFWIAPAKPTKSTENITSEPVALGETPEPEEPTDPSAVNFSLSSEDSGNNKSKREKILTLFEKWLNMMILERRVRDFKNLQIKYD